MFYSHEILSSRQHGVATIWLMATIGANSATKKLNKKAIQGVNVPKACETFIEPDAPIALRLQGNLLFGVSRVYAQQCRYVLSDAEKVQSSMAMFYRAFDRNNTDPEAGKARRNQLILLDDPNFIVESQLPAFTSDGDGNFTLPNLSQGTAKTSSQFSPLESRGSSSSRRSLLVGLNVHQSDPGSYQLHSPFGQSSLTGRKPQDDMMFFGDEEEMPIGGLGLEVDADGNIIEIPEPELPRIMQPESGGMDVFDDVPAAPDRRPVAQPDEHPLAGGELNLGFDEQPLPDAEALPSRQGRKRSSPEVDASEGQAGEESAAAAPAARRQRKQAKLAPDQVTMVTRDELRSWIANYAKNMETKPKPNRGTGPALAKRNGYDFTFGFGIGQIGAPTGIPGYSHPLADIFAGQRLQSRTLGIPLGGTDKQGREKQDENRDRRRSSSDAFGEDNDRRVRPRLKDEGPQQARAHGSDQLDGPPFDQEPQMEVGRDPGSALSDHPSMPWHRDSSMVPSSAKGHGSAQARAHGAGRASASPLAGRGSILPDIERFSDQGQLISSDGLGPLPEMHSSLSDLSGAPAQAGDGAGSQTAPYTVGFEGRQFLAYVDGFAGAARRAGAEGEEDRGRRWVDFDEAFAPGTTTRAIAAQAFYHVLALTTKGAMQVEQEGQNAKPFGPIRLGIPPQNTTYGTIGVHEAMASEGGEDDEETDSTGSSATALESSVGDSSSQDSSEEESSEEASAEE